MEHTTTQPGQDDEVHIVQAPPERNHGGPWVTIGLQAYRVPPLNFAALRELQDDIEALSASSNMRAETLDAVTRVVHAALVRNYPKITLGEVSEMLDVTNFREVAAAVLGASGFRRIEPGESSRPSPSTGTVSTSP